MPVYLGMSILDISKALMYEFWYDNIKPNYEDRAKLCYVDAHSFVIHMITDNFYKDIANDVERWFDTSTMMRMSKKVIGLFKDELEEKIMKQFCVLRRETYAYLLDDDSEYKKANGTKKCVNVDLWLKIRKMACLMTKSY